jgi:hypothetical protein
MSPVCNALIIWLIAALVDGVARRFAGCDASVDCNPVMTGAGPDGAIWFTCLFTDVIGRLVPPAPPPAPPVPAVVRSRAEVSFEIAVGRDACLRPSFVAGAAIGTVSRRRRAACGRTIRSARPRGS